MSQFATNIFGRGRDGSLTISADTVDAPIDSACSGSAGTKTLTATNVNFAANQMVLIFQSMHSTLAGRWEINEIASYTAGTITLKKNLDYDYYNSGNLKGQVLVIKEYSNVSVNSTKILSGKDWDGTVGGILTFTVAGELLVPGTISINGAQGARTATDNSGGASGGGFRGGNVKTGTSDNYGWTGESSIGPTLQQREANGMAGGGGNGIDQGGGGGGASYSVSGNQGRDWPSRNTGGYPGNTAGIADLTTLLIGAGGGGGSRDVVGSFGAGGSGAGIVLIFSRIITVTGLIRANGGAGGDCGISDDQNPPGGGGSGGSILIKSQKATIGTNLLTVTGGAGGTSGLPGGDGAGGVGRIRVDYGQVLSGTANNASYAQVSRLASADAGLIGCI